LLRRGLLPAWRRAEEGVACRCAGPESTAPGAPVGGAGSWPRGREKEEGREREEGKGKGKRKEEKGKRKGEKEKKKK
jgi:hypothetical protein